MDGKELGGAERKVYYLFYKPAGYITTLKDPQGRRTPWPNSFRAWGRGFIRGTAGRRHRRLLILTNDGELAARLMHPRHHVPKTYRVKVKGHLTGRDVERLSSGEIVLGDRPVAPAEVEVIKKGPDRSWLEMTLIEGRHRQVKRMMSVVGHPVLKLKRIAFGPLTLGRMLPGAIRPMEPAEIRALRLAAGLDGAERGARRGIDGGSARRWSAGRKTKTRPERSRFHFRSDSGLNVGFGGRLGTGRGLAHAAGPDAGRAGLDVPDLAVFQVTHGLEIRQPAPFVLL